ncbi:MAG: hypothetical protein V3T60_02455, partial [Candidatus Binatia bacterium]
MSIINACPASRWEGPRRRLWIAEPIADSIPIFYPFADSQSYDFEGKRVLSRRIRRLKSQRT